MAPVPRSVRAPRRALSTTRLLLAMLLAGALAPLGVASSLAAQSTAPAAAPPPRQQPVTGGKQRKPGFHRDTVRSMVCAVGDSTCVPVDPTPPSVEIVAPSVTYGNPVPVTINWCEDQSTLVSPGYVTLNGTDVGQYLTWTTTTRAGCAYAATSTGQLALNAGSNILHAEIDNRYGSTGSSDQYITFSDTTAARIVRVTADAQALNVAPNTNVSPRFVITHVSGWPAQVQVSASCTGSLTGCNLSASTVSLGSGSSAAVTVTTTTGAVGTSGTVAVSIRDATGFVTADTAFTIITPVAAPAAGLRIVDASAGATPSGAPVVERDLCLTISAGSGAAYECGDLRLVYGLQTTRTMNKSRTPTLVYGSQTARPTPVVNADYTLASNLAVPTSITAVLVVNGTERARTSFTGSSWTPGGTRRIGLGFDAPDLATGVYGYTLQITRNYSTGPTTEPAVSGQIIVVNRKDSELRPGWSLAGVERLYTAGNDRLWVAGDGSARLYRFVTTNVWAAQPLDRPDTLKFDGTNYTRYLPNNLRVIFNSAGQHVQTVNRLGHATSFGYDASGRLISIALPTPRVSTDGNSVLVAAIGGTSASGGWTASAGPQAVKRKPHLVVPCVKGIGTTSGGPARGAGRPDAPQGVISPGCGGDVNPPSVTISPRTAGAGNTVAVTIDWCDYESSLVSTSRRITLNGVSVSASFTYAAVSGTSCVGAARSTGTITLNSGSNTLNASINDASANTGSDAVTYTYTPPAPPPPIGRVLTYRFDYTNGFLDSAYVTNSSTSETLPAIRFVQVGSELQVQEPDGNILRFTYDATYPQRIVKRTSRRGAPLNFGYGAGQKLATVTLDMSSASQGTIVSTFTAQETQAFSAAIDPASAFAQLDGPRTDVADVSTFWLDGYGQPMRVRDPLGNETLAFRTNATYPAVVTRSVAPNRRELVATYDARGHILTSKDSLTGALTRYAWDQKWDVVDTIVSPTGLISAFGYDAATGNRLFQQAGPDAKRQVKFGYNANGLLVSTQGPSSARPSQVRYDVPLGNADTVVSARGMRSTSSKDTFGRVIATRSPIDTLQTKFTESRLWRDKMGRDTLSVTFAPEMFYDYNWALGPANGMRAPAESIWVATRYDADGNTISVSRRSAPDTNKIGAIVTQYRYDLDDRRVAEIAPDGRVDSTSYDPAGDAVESITRRGHHVTMLYDALGRMVQRNTPQVFYAEWTPTSWWSMPRGTNGYTILADVDRFAYDRAGHVVVAENGDARVRRAYNRTGTLATDTLLIRNYANSIFGHAYGIQHDYDLENRETFLRHPTNIAPVVGGLAKNLESFTYEPVTGQLATSTDVLSNSFRFTYDLEGRADSTYYPGGVVETNLYDDDGELVRHKETATNFIGKPGGFATNTIHDDQLFYDARGKVIEARGALSTAYSGYSGLGALVDVLHQPNRNTVESMEELYVNDALGNAAARWTASIHNSVATDSQVTLRLPMYHRGTARLDSIMSLGRGGSVTRYDEAGNKFQEASNGGYPSYGMYIPTRYTYIAYYYDAAQRLRAMDKRSCSWDAFNGGYCNWANTLAPSDKGYFEEYRYDALGRRILLRSRSDSTCQASTHQCISSIQRTVYDGDQVLDEIAMPGGDDISATDLERDTAVIPSAALAYYGRVLYAHVGAIDRPISVTRISYNDTFAAPIAVFPHVNWRGEFDVGSYPDGHERLCADTLSTQNCVYVDFPAPKYGVFNQDPWRDTYMPPSWFGSLVTGQHDATGQMYLRNRYYDPESQRFTQEDPIGLAGGLNAYGFARGDPINFADPFGLCGENAKDPCKTRNAAAREAMRAIFRKSVKENMEYDGEILKLGKGKYVYTPARKGKDESHGAPINTTAVGYDGWYHSHSADSHGKYDDEHFSTADKDISDDSGKPGYVVTPKGKMLRYDPDPKKKEGGPVSTVGGITP